MTSINSRDLLREVGKEGKGTFDMRNKQVVLFDGGLVSIRKKTRKKKAKVSNIIIREDACAIWFDAIDETIDYLKKMKTILKNLGHSTDGTLKSKYL